MDCVFSETEDRKLLIYYKNLVCSKIVDLHMNFYLLKITYWSLEKS